MTTHYSVALLDHFSAGSVETAWYRLVVPSRPGWFQSPQWVLSWWQTFGHDMVPFVLGVFASKELVAIAPWCISGGVLRCMGDPLNDLNCLPTHKGHDEDEVLRALLRGAKSFLPTHTTRLVLDCWPTPLPMLDDIDFSVDEQPELASPILELPADFATYLKHLPPARRKKLSQCLRRFHHRMPNARLELATESRRVVELGAAMLRMREESLGPRGLLVECEPTSRAVPFERMLIRLMENRKDPPHILMGALIDDNELVSIGLYFHWGQSLVKYMQGWALEHRKLSPGTVLDIEMIGQCPQLGVSVIDFGRGDEQYKEWFGAKPLRLYNYLITYCGSR